MSEAALTLNELLGGDEIRARLQATLRTAVGGARGVGAISPLDLNPIMGEAQKALASELNVTLNDILGSAWTTIGKLRSAADPTLHKPDETVLVPLLEHTVRSKQEPVLEFTYNGSRAFSLSFSVELVLRLVGVVLRVRGGRIREIASGTCTATASLSVVDVKVAERTTREIRLPLRVHLGSGIPIIGPHPRGSPKFAAKRLPSPPTPLRVVAGLLDVAAAMLILAVITAAVSLPPNQVVAGGILLWWITQLLPLITGATPGMLIVGLRVVDQSGADVSFREVLFRPIILLASIVTLHLRPDSRGLFMHDRVSNSRVVTDPISDMVVSR
jgi:uncharacterized RDD family membrane protein YckC